MLRTFCENLKTRKYWWLAPYNSSMFVFIAVFFFVKPDFFGQVGWLSQIYQIGLMLIVVVNVALYLLTERIKPVQVALVAFYGVLVLSTVLNKGDVPLIAKSAVKAMGICCLVLLGTKQNAIRFLRGVVPVFELWVYVNFVLMLLYPQGLYFLQDAYDWFHFLGHPNGIIKVAFPGIALALAYAICTKKPLAIARALLLFVVTGASVLRVRSMTAIVGLVIFAAGVLYLFVFRSTWLVRVINMSVVNVSCLSVFYIIINRLYIIAIPFIENVLKKSWSFSGRAFLWTEVRHFISQKPVLGWGVEYSAVRHARIGYNWSSFHSIILDILYDGGYIALVAFIGIFVCIWYNTKPVRRHFVNRYFIIVYLTYFMMGLFEVYTVDTFLLPLMVFMVWHQAQHLAAFADSAK